MTANSNSNSDVQNGRGLDSIKWAGVVVLVVTAVVANQVFGNVWVLYRSIGVVAAIAAALGLALLTEKGKQFIAFSQESLKEVRKVIWPTRQEATNTTLIVFVVTLIFGLVIYGLDSLLVTIVNLILGI